MEGAGREWKRKKGTGIHISMTKNKQVGSYLAIRCILVLEITNLYSGTAKVLPRTSRFLCLGAV